ncbi:ATP12 family chaperone protein [Pelagibius marinus]|uniref:ATP12 family chaperone protein n=1 Tax=Pelagibius marinus TaxID=2762760 RepID=UPI001D047166|nr:ATP12 family protein [Pelagibius marinus]
MQQKIKRFYKQAAAAPAEGGYTVELDGRQVRTPAKAPLVVPSQTLAEAVAAEWQSQGEEVDPRGMALNSLVCTAIDIVAPHRPAIVAELADYGSHDLLCYWTDETGELLRRQQQLWQPLLDWAAEELRAPLKKTCGITPQDQSPDSLAALKLAVEEHSDLELTGLAAAAKAAGSLLIGLALSKGRIDASEAVALSQLDELYQAERWGEDAEAVERRAGLGRDLESAARLLEIIR